jgi:hypothetical protein
LTARATTKARRPRRGVRLEIVATVLLALATVATAWSAYQSRQWTGEQAQGYSHATATRIAENRTSALANRQVQIDVATFIQWVDAHERHDSQRSTRRAFEGSSSLPSTRGLRRTRLRPPVRRRLRLRCRSTGCRHRSTRTGWSGRPRPTPRVRRRRIRTLTTTCWRSCFCLLALLRGHQHEAADGACPRGAARSRMCRLPGDPDLGGDPADTAD